MADFAYDDGYADGPTDRIGSVTTFMNWAGAFVSLALIAGLATWGWQLLKRDVSGVPVITALEGPMRVAPDNPGGDIADHQGLAVNRIPAVGEAAPGADTVVLAPQPVALAEEDTAMATLLPDTSENPVAENEPVAEIQGLSPTDLAVMAALAELETELAADPVLGGGAPEADGSPLAVASSPTPMQRPDPAIPAAATAITVAASTETAEIVPETIPAGTRLVQLGAYPSLTDAEAEWSRVETAFADYMGGKRRVIQEAETGGTSFYRLRVIGFDDLSDARRFCAVLVAGDTSCIPVVAR